MSDRTPRLSLPFILPAQAQKHVTHNEALLGLDTLVHLTILDMRNEPPETPNEGDCHLVGMAPEDPWTGKAGYIAAFQDGAWNFMQPELGWRAWFADNGQLRVFDGSVWRDTPLPEDAGCARLGVNATADATNRLAVASPASLFNHEGGSHRMKINRASNADTASMLFQSNWEGRAEMGLAGSEGFSVKVSADGSSWKTGLAIDAAGIARMEGRPAAHAGRTVADYAPSTGSTTGFGSLFTERGGFSLGAPVGGGSNRLIVPADGLYLIGLTASVVTSTGHQLSLLRNGAETIASLGGQHSGSVPDIRSSLFLAALSAGDWLSFSHAGAATLRFGSDGTSTTILLI